MAENISIFVAFIGGLAFFLSPCVLPLIPSYLSYITGISLSELELSASGSVRRRSFFHSLAFIVGFSIIFILLGMSASFAGGFLSRHIDIVRVIGGVVIVLFGICFVFSMDISRIFRFKSTRMKERPAGLIGSFLVGIFFSAGFTACATPILGSILVYAGIEANMRRGAILLSAFSLGLAIPFLLSSLGVGVFLKLIPRFSRFSRIFELFMGIILVIFGILVLANRLNDLTGYLFNIFSI